MRFHLCSHDQGQTGRGGVFGHGLGGPNADTGDHPCDRVGVFRGYAAAVAFGALALAGCVSPEQRAANQRAQAEAEYAQQQAEAAQYRARVIQVCEGYGFRQGTQDFSQCMMQVDQAAKQRQANMINAILPGLIQAAPLPLCSSFPPFLAGYKRASGECR